MAYIGSLFLRGSGAEYPSPTFPRGGLSAVFGVDLMMLVGTSPTFECRVEHKNRDETSFTTAGTFASMTSAPDTYTLEVSGLKEEIRLVYGVGGTPPTNMAYANILPPMWKPY